MTVYLKNIDTGVVKTLKEWEQEAIAFYTNLYHKSSELQEEFSSLSNYLAWVDERGYFYTDLIECDEHGNIAK